LRDTQPDSLGGPPEPSDRIFTIRAARNEQESLQIVITPHVDLQKVQIRVMDFVLPSGKGIISKDSATVYRVGYVPIREPTSQSSSTTGTGQPTSWPDPLIPHKKPVAIRSASGNQPFWVTIKVPRVAAPGLYEGSIHVLTDQKVAATVPVDLRVWDFTLPDALSMQTLLGLSEEEIAWGHETEFGSPVHRRLTDKYFTYLKSKGFQPSGVPVPLDAREIDRYLNRSSSPAFFPLDVAEVSRGEEGSVVARLHKDPQLRSRTVFFLAEEPKPEKCELVKLAIDHLKEKLPGVRFMIAAVPAPDLANRVDIWAPSISDFDVRSARQSQETGQQIWWKLSGDAASPFPNLLIDIPGIHHRMIPWLKSHYQITGLYVPSVVMNSRQDPEARARKFQDVWTQPMTQEGNGGGFLLYPVGDTGHGPEEELPKGPISSIRLELLREGMEDAEYLNLLACTINETAVKLGTPSVQFGLQRAREVSGLLIQNLGQYSHDSGKMERVRSRAADEILAIRQQSPSLIVRTVPPDGTSTAYSGAGLTVEGMTTAKATVKMAGQPVTVDDRGSFKAKVYPILGANRILIEAFEGDRSTAVTRTITIVKDPALARAEEMLKTLPLDDKSLNESSSTLNELLRKCEEGKYTPENHLTALRLVTGKASISARPPGTDAGDDIARSASPPVQLNLPPGTTNRVYVSLAQVCAKLRQRQQSDVARIAEEKLKTVTHNTDPQTVACTVEPTEFLGKWGFRASNGLVDVVIWRQGARIVQFEAGKIPLLHQPNPDAVKENDVPTAWQDMGGFEDAGSELLLESLDNWNLVVTRHSPVEITIEARKLLQQGSVKLRRRMTLKKGDPVLYVQYEVANRTTQSISFPWRARITPGIGFTTEDGRGNPWDDEIVVPGAEDLIAPVFSSHSPSGKTATQTLSITRQVAVVYDRLCKAALVITPPTGMEKIRYSTNPGAGSYSLEFGNVFGDGNLIVSAGETASFELQLAGLIGVSNPDEAIQKYAARADASQGA